MVAFTEAQKREFLAVLQQFGNHIANACKAYGINRSTYYGWLEQDEWFKSEIDQINEAEIDDAEQMHRYLRQGIPQIVKVTNPDGTVIERMIGWEEKPDRYALEFYLSRKGKTRGWGEKSKDEQERPGDVVIVRIPDNGRDYSPFDDVEIDNDNPVQDAAGGEKLLPG